MQPVTVEYRYRRLNTTELWKRLWLGHRWWSRLLILSMPALAFLPLLVGMAWQGQWLAFTTFAGGMGVFYSKILASQQQSYDRTAAMMPTLTFTLFPEGFRVDVERGSWSRYSWTAVQKLLPLESALLILFREDDREGFFHVPRDAFATPAECEAWQTGAQHWHREAVAARCVLPPAEVSLTERQRIAVQMSSDEAWVWLARKKMAEEFPQTLPPNPPDEKPGSKGHDALFGAMTLAALVLLFYDPTASRPGIPGLNLGLLIVSVAILFGCMKLMAWLSDTRDRASSSATPCTVVLAEEGMLTRSPSVEKFRSWLDVDVVTEDQERLLLWRRGINCGIIPCRVFARPSDADATKRWIAKKLPRRFEENDGAPFADDVDG